VSRPRILLCPQFTEVEWTIAPLLSEAILSISTEKSVSRLFN